MGYCQWFNREALNHEENWFPLAFVEDQKSFEHARGYIQEERFQDYHDMITKVFEEMKKIHDAGEWKWTLSFNDGNDLHVHKDMIVIPCIQYFIGDYKNHDVFCGRLRTHSLKTPLLCRHCKCPSIEAENPEYQCQILTKDDFIGKSACELKIMSHVKIKNAFYDLPMMDGGNVYTNTPPETLHAILLGFITYLNKDLTFTDAANRAISDIFVEIYPYARYQSERNMPSISTIRNGIYSVKGLKAEERLDRAFTLFL